MKGFDKALKGSLIKENCQEHLQRKFEKIVLEEHITNLYAPRIIAKYSPFIFLSDMFPLFNHRQATINQGDSPIKKSMSLAESRKSFKAGLASSRWRTYKSQKQTDPRY